jgi:hypothetical protein
MARWTVALCVLTAALATLEACGAAGGRHGAGPATGAGGPGAGVGDAGPATQPDAGSAARDGGSPPPADARAIRDFDWGGIDCRGDSALQRAVRLDFEPSQGWSCRVTGTSFADLTGDGVEEAVVSLEFRLTVVEQLANGRTSERRMRSNEHVVVALRDDEPELLANLDPGQGEEVTSVEPVNGDLRVELQRCWDCGCDTVEEFWVWDGHRFAADEARSRPIDEAPDCDET